MSSFCMYFQIGDFTVPHGPNLPEGFDVHMATPIDYFGLVFRPDMMAQFARNTNNYARWKMETSGENDPRWSETDVYEIRAYIGMNILMGINPLPEADMYWSRDTFLGNIGIQETMTSNRYNKLTQYFHVSDRATEPRRGEEGYDRLYKVRPVLDHVLETFPAVYNLSQNVSVDEAMIRYTGRLAFRQYMPAKPIKRGMKLWMLCDATTAYLSKFEVYMGRQNNTTENGLGYNVVTRLTEELRNTNRHVYFDNFFTSVPLMNKLLEDGLYACGTVRVNRKNFPNELKKPKELKNRGDYKVLQMGESNLTASVWRDKKLVHHLSTLSRPDDIEDAQRRIGQDVVRLRQPHSVAAYNRNMNGVDVYDQYRMQYEVGRCSKKWWKFLFWFAVNAAIVNAFILYRQTSRRQTKKKRYSHLDFRMELLRSLIGGYSKRKRHASDVQNVGVVDAENIQGHVHGRLPGAKRRCRYHARYLNERRETVYGCTVCNVHLCKDGCHNLFHNRR